MKCSLCNSSQGRPHSLTCLAMTNNALAALRRQHARRRGEPTTLADLLNWLYYDVPAYEGARP